MQKNMGALDRWLRILLAVVIIILYLTNVISGTWAVIGGIVALIFILTSLIGWCPLYTIFKINTGKNK